MSTKNPIVPRTSANPIANLWLKLRYAAARGLRRTANWVSPDRF